MGDTPEINNASTGVTPEQLGGSGPSTDLNASTMPAGTTKVENGIAYDASGKQLGSVSEQPPAKPAFNPNMMVPSKTPPQKPAFNPNMMIPQSPAAVAHQDAWRGASQPEQTEQPGMIHKLWDWVNKGLVSQDTISKALVNSTERKQGQIIHIPGFGDIDAGVFDQSVRDSAAGVLSSFTSPLSIALFGAGPLAKAVPAIAPVAHAAGALAGVGFAGQGAVQALTPRQENETEADALQRRLNGASQIFMSAAGLKDTRADVSVGEAARNVKEAVKSGAGATADVFNDIYEGAKQAATLGKAPTFEEAIRRISPPSKGKAAAYLQSVKNVSQDLQAIVNKNPATMEDPQALTDAIQQHIDQQTAELQRRAHATMGDRAPVVPDIEQKLNASLDDFIAKNAGGLGTPDEVEAARQKVKEQFTQLHDEGNGLTSNRMVNLHEAENLRQKLGKEGQKQFATNAVPTTEAYKLMAQHVATEVLRPAIDERYTMEGVDNVQESRQKMKDLIEVKDQIVKAQQQAIAQGKPGVIKSILKKVGTPAGLLAVLGGSLGPHGILGVGALLLGDRIADNLRNPNANMERAIDLAAQNPNAQATEIDTTRANGQTPPSGTPGAPTTPAPPTPPTPQPAPTNHALHATLATYYDVPVDSTAPSASLDALKKRFYQAGVDIAEGRIKPTPEQVEARKVVLDQVNKATAADRKLVADNYAKALDKHNADLEKYNAAQAAKAEAAAKEQAAREQELAAQKKQLEESGPEEVPTKEQLAAIRSNRIKSEQPFEIGEELPAPNTVLGLMKTPIETRGHEAAHIHVADVLGFDPTGGGILSHLHPDNVADGAHASAPVSDESLRTDGRIDKEKMLDRLHDIIAMYLAGPAYEEVAHGTTLENNIGRHGDLAEIEKLYDALDIPVNQRDAITEGQYERVKAELTKPNVIETIQKYTKNREAGIHEKFHMTPARANEMLGELRKLRGSDGTDEPEELAGENDKNSNTPKPRGKSGVDEGANGEREEVGTEAEEGLGQPKLKSSQVLEGIKKTYGETDSPKMERTAGFITPEARFIDLPVDHSDAIEQHGGEKANTTKNGVAIDNRKKFVNDSGAIRVHKARERAGDVLSFSVPKGGVTPEQASAMEQSFGANGNRNGVLRIERADISPKTRKELAAEKEFPRPNDVKPMLEKIGALNPKMAAKKGPAVEARTQNDIRKAANEYNKSEGREEVNPAPVTEDPRVQEMGRVYDELKHNPDDPAVKKSYDAFKNELDKQYDMLEKQGFKFDTSKEDPYPSYEAMRQDILRNKHLTAWEGAAPPEGHPLAERDPKTGMNYNEKFRLVHDVLGHAAHDADFSGNGEESAWNYHRQMFSPEAQPALAAETRGQVASYTRNGKFPETQKAVLMPAEYNVRPEDLKAGKSAPEGQEWHDKVASRVATEPAGGVDPYTGVSAKEGIGTEIVPEARQTLDHTPTAEDFKKYRDQHEHLFQTHPELKVGWDTLGDKPELNIGAVGPNAEEVGRKLGQRSVWNIGDQREIPTGGTGAETQFPNYPIEERLKDLGKTAAKPEAETTDYSKTHPHIPADMIADMRPEHLEYLKDKPAMQKNVVKEFNKIDPSIDEIVNAAKAGHALGGWWQRFMDTFKAMGEPNEAADIQQLGPSHEEALKAFHGALSGNKAVEHANKLAWNAYRDWLDMGRPRDRASINQIIAQNGKAKGVAAISDTHKRGKVVNEGLDTTKLYKLVNSPQMRDANPVPFTGNAFLDSPVEGVSSGAKKIPSMVATTAGEGNLDNVVFDTHMKDIYGQLGLTDAKYIADTLHITRAAREMGLKPGEAQEQIWGTVLALKSMLKDGMSPEDIADEFGSHHVAAIGKDYAQVILDALDNDPSFRETLDGLAKHGFSPTSDKAVAKLRDIVSQGQSRANETAPEINKELLAKSAERLGKGMKGYDLEKARGATNFDFGANSGLDKLAGK